MAEQEMQKTQNAPTTERIRNVKVFAPRVDIYENKDSLFLLADMPGVDEKTVDIELEKNVLTITGRVDNGRIHDATMMYSEYEIGDYERVFTLSDEIDRAQIVKPQEVPPTVVTMNSTVRFIDDKSKSEFQLTLVYPDEIAAKLAGEPTKMASEAEAEPVQKVSVLAPVGSALLGLSVGQSIEWQIPGGRQLNLRILGVVRQPEAQGDFSS